MLLLELSACVIVYVTSLKIGHYSVSLLSSLVLMIKIQRGKYLVLEFLSCLIPLHLQAFQIRIRQRCLNFIFGDQHFKL